MKFADKLILLRRQHGISQEELADRLNVSRQSVSKWESAQSMPELTKILQLAEMFHVSTDYLLKEDMERESTSAAFTQEVTHTKQESQLKQVTQIEAEEYIAQSKIIGRLYTIGTSLCIISPIPLIFLLANSFSLFSPIASILVGIISLFVFVCFGVACFIYVGYKNQKFQHIENYIFSIERATQQYLEELKSTYYSHYIRNMIIGVIFCILSSIPILVFALLVPDYIGLGVNASLILVVFGVALIVYGNTRMSAINKLLGVGEYSANNRKIEKLMGRIASIYWTLVVAIYLLVSFLSQNWSKSWIVWPVSAILYAVVASIVEIFLEKQMNQNREEK